MEFIKSFFVSSQKEQCKKEEKEQEQEDQKILEQMTIQDEASIMKEIIEEREKEIKEIHKKAMILNEVSRDLGKIMNHDVSTVNNITKNIGNAKSKTLDAVVSLATK